MAEPFGMDDASTDDLVPLNRKLTEAAMDGSRIETLIRRNHDLIAAAVKARSEAQESNLRFARMGAEGAARRALWQWFRRG